MNTWVRRSLNTGALAAGALLAAGVAGPAHADTTAVSAGNNGILNGTQVYAPIQLPVNVCGNSVAVLGVAQAGCEGGSVAALNPEWGWDHYQRETTMVSAGNNGILNGTQIYAPIQAPVNVCGNAIGVLGVAQAGCAGGSSAPIGKHRAPRPSKGRPGPCHHQAAPVPAKVGGYNKDAKPKPCTHDNYGKHGRERAGALESMLLSTGNNGIGNGTQVYAPIQAPIDVCGNAIGVLGIAQAGCEGGSSARLLG